jgi:hypothetical protein
VLLIEFVSGLSECLHCVANRKTTGSFIHRQPQ